MTLAVSFAVFGSVSFSADLVAVLVRGPDCVTVAVSVSVADAPLASAPMFQIPVPLV